MKKKNQLIAKIYRDTMNTRQASNLKSNITQKNQKLNWNSQLCLNDVINYHISKRKKKKIIKIKVENRLFKV